MQSDKHEPVLELDPQLVDKVIHPSINIHGCIPSFLLVCDKDESLQSQFLFTPLLHGQQDGNEAFALGRQFVLHARWHLAVIDAFKESVFHQLLELHGEGGFGDVANATPKLPEMPHVFERDVEEYLDLPFPADHALECGDRFASSTSSPFLLAIDVTPVYCKKYQYFQF